MAISCGMHNISAVAAGRLLLSGFPIFLHARDLILLILQLSAFLLKKRKKEKKKAQSIHCRSLTVKVLDV